MNSKFSNLKISYKIYFFILFFFLLTLHHLYPIILVGNSIIYIPDIDAWEDWDTDINELVKTNDILILDGTFYNKNEIKFRDISKIPHPEIKDTMQRLSLLDDDTKRKIHFIHLNHTNDAIIKNSKTHNIIVDKGFSVARQNQTFNIN